MEYNKRILVPCKDGNILINTKNICVIEAYNGMAKLLLNNGNHICIPESLSYMMGKIGSERFYRVNRRYIVNKEHVLMLKNWFNYDMIVIIEEYQNLRIVLNRRHVQEFKKWVED